MDVLFLTIDNVTGFRTRSIYMDLANTFINHGHFVTILSVCEQRDAGPEVQPRIETDHAEIIRVFTPNVTKVSNYIQKGLSLFSLARLMRKAAKKATSDRIYDLVLYGSPPVSFYSAVGYVKKRQRAYTYLLLKDIWPYDCLYGDVLSRKGWKGIAFNILRLMALRLYSVSDTIGCMSPANIRFLTENEPRLSRAKIEVNPNSIRPFGKTLSEQEKHELRGKYGIPADQTVFVFGGNIGIAQGLDFALKAVEEAKEIKDALFVFIGSGTAQSIVESQARSNQLPNLLFIPSIPKDEYEQLVYACDVGLVFLNHECLSPNFPSRILCYLQASLPVLLATDPYTDVGSIAEENGFGLWCESNDPAAFVRHVHTLMDPETRMEMGNGGHEYFLKEYTVDHSYELIMKRLQKKD